MTNAPPKPLAARLFSMNDVRDADNRPLGESRCAPALRSDVTLETRACPYADARHGHPINVSALKQLTQHWDDVATFMAEAMRCYYDHRSIDRPNQWEHLLGVATFLIGLPSVCMLQRSGPLPVTVALSYKVAAGVHYVVETLLKRYVDGRLQELPTCSAHALQRYAFENAHMITEREACAGPPHLIERALEIFFDPQPQSSRPLTTPIRDEQAVLRALQSTHQQRLHALHFEALDRWASETLLCEFSKYFTAKPRANRAFAAATLVLDHCPIAPIRCVEPVPPISDEDYVTLLGGASRDDLPCEHPAVTPAALLPMDMLAWGQGWYVRYKNFRHAYDACIQAETEVIRRCLIPHEPRPIPAVPHFYPRLQTQTWLELLFGTAFDFSWRHQKHSQPQAQGV